MRNCKVEEVSFPVLLVCLVLACGLLLSGCGGNSSSPAESPSGTTGSLSGTVQLAAGGQASPKDSIVKVQNAALAVKGSTVCYTAVPDENGSWAVLGIPVGTYTVQVFLNGYALSYTTASVTAGAWTNVPGFTLQPASSPPLFGSFTITPSSGPVNTSGVFTAAVSAASSRNIRSVTVFSSTMQKSYALAKLVSSVNSYTASFTADSSWSGTVTWSAFAVDSSNEVSGLEADFTVIEETPTPSPSPTSSPTPTPSPSGTPTPTPTGTPTPTPSSGPSPLLGTWQYLDSAQGAGFRYVITQNDIRQDVYYGGQWYQSMPYSEQGMAIRFVSGNTRIEVYRPPFTETIQTFEVGTNSHLFIDGIDSEAVKVY